MANLSAHDRFALRLLLIFLVVWSLLAIDPWFRSDWLLENVIVFLAVPALVQMHRGIDKLTIGHVRTSGKTLSK